MKMIYNSPTLYTARNNGKRNNGGNTMVTGTTMINNGMGCRGIWSMFLCFCHGATSDGIGFGERWFGGNEVGFTRDYVNRMSPE